MSEIERKFIEVQSTEDLAGLLARHAALLERVTVLERTLEQLTERETVDVNGEYEFDRYRYGSDAAHLARKALDG